MWVRLLFGLLVTVSLVAGYPYAALILTRAVGTNTVVMTEHTGMQRTLISGPDAPRPDWLPALPRGRIVHAAHWLPSPDLPVAGGLELLTHKHVDDIKSFYIEGLEAAGFQMRDAGYGPLNQPTAEMLGIASMLHGWDGKRRLAISITTRTSSGFIWPSRTVQINWLSRNAPFE